LRNATGPFGRYFRGMVPDVNSLAKLDPVRLKAGWAEDVERIAQHFKFDDKQRETAKAELTKAEADADGWFHDKEFLESRRKYIDELKEVMAVERNWSALSYERERAAARRKDLDIDRKKLVSELDASGGALRDAVVKLATDEQKTTAGSYPGARWTKLTLASWLSIPVPEWTSLQWVDHATIYGLLIMGVCLILGLFTRLSALAGAVFLAQIYLSMPPWPGLPPNPMAEGHYFIVNKNLIEMLACLVIATTPTGRWIGLDALLFGWMGRLRHRDDADGESDRRQGRRPRSFSQPRNY